ncbi:K Homology domain containing protein [Oryctes borbonicus]|uniref:K Homology domain containing protein n=1 Tax=Oryctes borbonicus TaxID=1629725 RepID=A0A0T6AVE4_9SCAR|nr:K Homology domain containing protein [Oryctes borbonicus]
MRSSVGTKTLTTLLGVSLVGVASYLVYLLFKNDDEDDDYMSTLPKTSRFKVIELRIQKEMVRLLIGRNGKTIKQIEQQSSTKINFKSYDPDVADRVCVIKGSLEGCNIAENLIQEFIASQPVLEVCDMWVPQSFVGKIIGRCGEQIMEISSLSGAKINFTDDDRSAPTRRLVIKGTKEQILVAKSYIEDVIKQCEVNQQRLNASLAKREPRLPLKNPDSPKTPKETPKVEKISSMPGQPDSQFDVYVSAMVDPSHFWLQIVGPKATELDQLVDDMTEYYNKPDNREFHVLDKVEVGDLVAALFKYDNKWYRAEVLKIIESNTSEPEAELYYVDYGDTDVVPCKDTYEIRTDFLQLHFQAIECYLSRIDPIGATWSEEAVDKFEEWTHVAQWKKLSAKINGYTEREKTRAKREGSPVPGVDLFDVTNERDLDIAEELVKHGFAVFKKENELRLSTSRTTSTSNISVESI